MRHATAPAFLALKWAAFVDRGGGDLVGSHDLEDIFNEDILGEVLQAHVVVDPRQEVTDVHRFVLDQLRALTKLP